MNQAELIDATRSHDAADISSALVERTLKAAASAIREHFATADADAEAEVTLPGLGKLVAVTRAARAGRNPQTGEAIEIPEHRTVVFRPSSALKAAINP